MSIIDDPLWHLLLLTNRPYAEDQEIEPSGVIKNDLKPAYLQKHSRNTGAAKLKRAAKHAKRNRK